MRKYTYILLSCLLALLLGSCELIFREKPRRVVVIHTVGNEGQEAAPFRKMMEQKFREYGVKADIHHLYLNLLQEPSILSRDSHQQDYLDSLLHWNPEVILLNEDGAMDWWFKETANPQDTLTGELGELLRRVPTILAGMNALDRQLYDQYDNLTGFEDVIDLPENLKLYRQITDNPKVTIELDHELWDSQIRTRCYEQLEGQPDYVNNGDFHLGDSFLEEQDKRPASKLIVDFISACDPESNRDKTQDEPENAQVPNPYNQERGINHFRDALDECKHHPGQLQVKYDIYSNTFIAHSLCPQFTCIRHQFNEADHMLLAGYFSSLETQISDQVSYAVKILDGARPKSLKLDQHQKGYYMDYEAMRKFEPSPLKYSDYADQFTIINAPLRETHAYLFHILNLCGILLALLLLAKALKGTFAWFRKSDRRIQKEIRAENERRQFTLDSAKAHLFEIRNNKIQSDTFTKEELGIKEEISLTEFREYLLPDSYAAYENLLRYKEWEGPNKIRLHISADGTEEHGHWYELSYQIETENIQQQSFMGIATLIDEVIDMENKLQEIQEEINKNDQKQNFLNNISHDLRTPLNAVTGFAQLISSTEMEFSPEELKEFNAAVKENSDMMQNMIESVIKQRQTNQEELEIKPLKASATQFVKRVYQTHQILVPSHLKLLLELDEPDRAIYIDPNRTRQVLNNFVGNSFKFTPQGSITIGWKYLEETEEVMFYCKDTGIGLSEEDRQQVFERFFKAKENAKGTGLGLNISKQIVEQQGGTIGVESKLGKGSTFWIKLKEYKGE